MQKINRFLFAHFTWLFPLLLLACIVMSAVLLKDNGCMQNVYSPRGIVSLQMAGTPRQADSIIATWARENCYCHIPGMVQSKCDQHTQCQKAIFYAIKNVKTDFWFIPLYVITLLVLLARLNRKYPFNRFLYPDHFTHNQPGETIKLATWLLSGFVLLAGVCDVLENIYLLQALHNRSGNNHESFLYPALIKFICLASVVVYVLLRASPWVTRFFKRVIQLTWRMRIAVFSLLLLALPLWFTDQGQDLLANINNTHSGPIGVFITLSVLATLNWHLPKIYRGTEPGIGRHKNTTPATPFSLKQLIARNWDDEDLSHATSEKRAGRMFGILTFLTPACAISNALDVFKADHFFKFISPVALLLLLSTLFYIVIRYNWLEQLNRYITENLHNKKGKTLRFLLTFFIATTIGFIVLPIFSNSSAAEKLTLLQVNLILLAVVFLMFTEYRKTRLLGKWFTGIPLNWFIWGGATLCVLLFLLFNFKPLLLNKLNRSSVIPVEATTLLICAIIFHTVLFSLMLLFGRRYRTDIISIFLVTGLAISLAGVNNFHTVRRVKKENSLPAAQMSSFKEHLKAWLTYRKEEINQFDTSGGRKYPFFLVNSYGGGIRAAAWTSMLFSRTDRYLQQVRPNVQPQRNNLHHYTFAVSGISGGTVGLALHTAYLFKQIMANPAASVRPYDSLKLSAFYQSDFLSPVTTVLLGRDILASVLGVESWNDRAAILEQTWERQARAHGLGNLAIPFRSTWNQGPPQLRYEIPLLFSNTFHAEDGVPGILAPVQLDSASFPSATLVNNLAHIRERDLRLSTGAFISARFPYVTPSARFGYGHHFLDGGVKEYSGCATLFQVYRLIEKLRKEDPFIDSMMQKVQVYHFNIKNYIPSEEEKKVRNPFEVTLPLTALVQASYGTTQEAVLNMEAAVGKSNSFMVQPTVEFINEETGCTNRYSPVLPLGWKISKEALLRMWKSIDREEQTPGSGLQQLFSVFGR